MEKQIENKTIIIIKKTKVDYHDVRYQKIQEYKAKIIKIQLENLNRKTSPRSHEIYRKTKKKPQLDQNKIIDKDNPMYKILVNAQKNNQLKCWWNKVNVWWYLILTNIYSLKQSY